MAVSTPIKDRRIIKLMKDYYKKKNDKRDLLFFMLAINTGLKINEILDLNISDVKNKTELCVNSECGIKKNIPLNQELQNLIKDFTSDKSEKEPLFLSSSGKRLSRVGAFLLFKEVCKDLNLGKDISISSLRKTFGYHYYVKYKDLSFLQWLFNQNSVNATLKYIDIQENMNLRFYNGVGL